MTMETMIFKTVSNNNNWINILTPTNNLIGFIMLDHYDKSKYLLSFYVNVKNSIAQKALTMNKNFSSYDEVMNFVNENIDVLKKKYKLNLV